MNQKMSRPLLLAFLGLSLLILAIAMLLLSSSKGTDTSRKSPFPAPTDLGVTVNSFAVDAELTHEGVLTARETIELTYNQSHQNFYRAYPTFFRKEFLWDYLVKQNDAGPNGSVEGMRSENANYQGLYAQTLRPTVHIFDQPQPFSRNTYTVFKLGFQNEVPPGKYSYSFEYKAENLSWRSPTTGKEGLRWMALPQLEVKILRTDISLLLPRFIGASEVECRVKIGQDVKSCADSRSAPTDETPGAGVLANPSLSFDSAEGRQIFSLELQKSLPPYTPIEVELLWPLGAYQGFIAERSW